jgi:hypothetical protein
MHEQCGGDQIRYILSLVTKAVFTLEDLVGSISGSLLLFNQANEANHCHPKSTCVRHSID